jgi:5'(3')-deoxyribonucleotidase
MKRIFIDMDGVICDYFSHARKSIERSPRQKYPQSQWGFFLDIPEIENAVKSINHLKNFYDVRILTRPSINNLNCFSEKAKWVLDHLGFEMLEKLIISSDKSIVKGEYLIDDQNNANQDKFEGKWIKFGSSEFPNWNSVIAYFLSEISNEKQNLCENIIGKSRDCLKKIEYEVRIFDDNGSITPLDPIINYNRLNIRIFKDLIDYAYFG